MSIDNYSKFEYNDIKEGCKIRLLSEKTVFLKIMLAGVKDEHPSIDDSEYFEDMPSSLKGTTVKFATWIDHTQTSTAQCISGFEKDTGMDLQLVYVSQSDYIIQLNALIASGQAPDVVVENGDFPSSISVLQPLSAETNGLDPLDAFWNQNISKMYQVGDNYYLVNGRNSSWYMGGGIVYYNKTLLDKVGIKTPADYVRDNNWNVDTMWTLMHRINDTCRFGRPGTSVDFETWLNAYGGGQIIWDTAANRFKNGINSDASVNAINYLIKGKDQGLLKIIESHDDDLVSGEIAMEICGSYGLRKSPGWFWAMDSNDLAFEVLPKISANSSEYPYVASGRAYGICKGAKNPKGAAYFLRYFLNDANYDMDQIFKNEEAKELYYRLRENADYSKISFTAGAKKLISSDYNNLSLIDDVIYSDEENINVNIIKTSSKINEVVAKANELISGVMEEQ